jgi:hypothetical protein
MLCFESKMKQQKWSAYSIWGRSASDFSLGFLQVLPQAVRKAIGMHHCGVHVLCWHGTLYGRAYNVTLLHSINMCSIVQYKDAFQLLSWQPGAALAKIRGRNRMQIFLICCMHSIFAVSSCFQNTTFPNTLSFYYTIMFYIVYNIMICWPHNCMAWHAKTMTPPTHLP